MTSIIHLTPLSGAMDESPACYLLQIDDFRVLLDTGWDEKFSGDLSLRLGRVAEKIDAVLLSHSDTGHVGALPYLVAKCGLNCLVYVTKPVSMMGQMALYDTFLNHHNTREFNLFSLDDIDQACDRFQVVSYGQSVALKGKGHGISITAYQAGHTLGGAYWKISKGNEDVYYVIDHNNKKERHVHGLDLDGGSIIRKNGILITNCLNALTVQEKRRKQDEMLMGVMTQTLRMGGNVLIATDTAGRSLELTLMLDQMCRMKDSPLANYSIVFLNNVAFNVIEFAKQQIEWMGEKLQKSYESTRVNPFQLRNVVVAHTLVELAQVKSPKVVVASTPDLESGFSRDLFLQWCHDPVSTVVLTCKTSPGTLARELIDSHVPGRTINVQVRGKVRVDVGGGDHHHHHMESHDDEEDRCNNNGGRKRKAAGGGIGGGSGGGGKVKCICVNQQVVVNCGVRFIEFEGRSDVEGSGRIVKEMEPQKLVLVRGTPNETAAFKTLCQSILPTCSIFHPSVGETLDLTNATDLMQVTLSEQLTSSLEFQKLRGMELSWVDCRVGVQEQVPGSNKTDDMLGGNVPYLYACKSSSSRSNRRPRAPLFVNKLRLSEFKQILSKHGIEAAYNDKVLSVKCGGGVVYIQRHSDTKEIVVECDGLPEEYYVIRELLYQQFAVL